MVAVGKEHAQMLGILEIVPFLSTVALHTLSFASLGNILLRSSLSLVRIPSGRTKTSNRKIKCLCG